MKPKANLCTLSTLKKGNMACLSLFAAVAILFMTGTFLLVGGESNASNGGKLSDSKNATAKSSNILQVPKQIVDGSINPDNIRPEVAYSIFFRMLTGGKNGMAQSHSRALRLP
jgi:hypothetical protein